MTVPENRPAGKHVLLMGTCLCDAFFDKAGIATVEILEHLGVKVEFPEDQTCCGQPAFNYGDWEASRKVAKHAASVFAGDLPVIVPSGSCAAMNFHGNPMQFEEQPDEAVTSLATRTWELCDFIVNGLGVTEWNGKLDKPTKIAFHHSCHTRGTPTRDAARTLLGGIENLEMVEYGQGEQCCGFGGTFSVTFPTISGRMGTLKLDHLLENKPDLLCSADMSCLMHLQGLATKQDRELPIKHAIQLLHESLPEN